MRIERVLAAVVAALMVAVSASAQAVFINEIHYDNTGTDTGEAVEVIGPAGTDLTGWSIVLYNGSGGASYATLALPPGTLANQCCGFGTAQVAYAGIQNGSPDGLALVNNLGLVVQFLSYEGTFAATNGPAVGLTSVDIGVSQNGSEAVGLSLQLAGSGSTYTDFHWVTLAPATFGSCNANQYFGVQLAIDDVTHDEGNVGTTTYTFTVSLSMPALTGGVEFDIATADNTATTADNDYTALSLVDQTIAAGNSSRTFDVTVNGDTTFEASETFYVNITNVSGLGVCVSDGQGVGTITNDDAITLSIDDVTHDEGDSGTTTYTFTVSLSAPAPTGGATFNIATADDTATTADSDYVANSLTGQTIAEGSSTFSFDVTVNGDTTYEPDETFNVNVTDVSGTNVYLGDGVGAGTITNDDSEPLVINEIDYDQPSTDTAEFVEIYNAGSAAIDLDPFTLVGINGSGGATYLTVNLPSVSLAAGDYYVVCANADTVPYCDLDVSPNTDLVQNGAPDAVALMNGTRIVDTVSYEGNTVAPYTEGTGTSAADSGSVAYVGISRFPDGTDTDVNDADLSLRCITPGAANSSSASGCTDPGPFLVVRINEVDSDTPGTDAAEFVELYDGGVGNVPLDGLVVVFFNGSNDLSYAAYDLDGYSTDANGYFLLGNAALDEDITFADNFLQNGADAVALYRANGTDFSTNTPVTATNLQDAIVYDTSDADDAGLLVLLTGGGGQVNEDANGLGASQSSQRCPNGSGGFRNTSAYIQTTPTPNASNFCVSGTYEIWQIQGSGLASPYAGTVVATDDNIVTAVGPQGFFIQTPDARADADVETSNGIYVYTNSAPTVAVGQQVDVTGLVQEFYDFTEFTGPIVVVDSSGNTLPAVVDFNAALPSPNQPQAATAYERYEGMRIAVASGVAGGPSQYFGSDPTAEAYIVASTARPYREPGALYPGLGGTIPVWDGNPEVFELDSDKFAEAVDPINAGSTFSAEGVLAYEFDDYELWATSVTVNQATLPVPVRPRAAGEFTVGSFNVLRLFDDVNDPEINDPTGEDVVSNAEYTRHLRKLSQYIREVLDSPDIIGVQEVENLGALQALAAQIHSDDNTLAYTAYLEEGNDIGGIDVGFLVRDTMAVDAVTQIGKDEIFAYDDSLLNDRPPLLFEGRYTANGVPFAVKVLVIHNRSLSSIESSDRVRQKRLAQAQSVATIAQGLQTADPDVRLLVVGDFNAYEVTDGYVDVTGQIKGDFVPTDNLLSGPDLVDPNLTDEVLNLPAAEHYSFIFDGTAQVLDHALWAQGVATFARSMEYGRGNADAPEILEYDDSTPLRCSDHDGLVFYVMSDENGDGYPDDAPQFETASNVNGTATGDVTDASGIVSVVLITGSSNVVLQTTGNPGDTSWGWSVTLTDLSMPGTAILQATDADGRVTTYIVILAAAAPIPVTSSAGLALLAVLLAAAAAVALRRT